jgi:DNA-binding CsgD family transcriptional regulator
MKVDVTGSDEIRARGSVVCELDPLCSDEILLLALADGVNVLLSTGAGADERRAAVVAASMGLYYASPEFVGRLLRLITDTVRCRPLPAAVLGAGPGPLPTEVASDGQRPRGPGATAPSTFESPPSESSVRGASGAKRTRDRPSEAPAGVLTRREGQIVGLISAGLSNADIADHLHLAEQTVKQHVTAILRKLGARNRAHAVSLVNHSNSCDCN